MGPNSCLSLKYSLSHRCWAGDTAKHTSTILPTPYFAILSPTAVLSWGELHHGDATPASLSPTGFMNKVILKLQGCTMSSLFGFIFLIYIRLLIFAVLRIKLGASPRVLGEHSMLSYTPALCSVSYLYNQESTFSKLDEIYIKAIASAQWKSHSVWKEQSKCCLEGSLSIFSPPQIEFLLSPALGDNELFSGQSPELLSSLLVYQEMLLLKHTT